MKLPGEENSKSMGFSVVSMLLGLTAFVVIMLFAVMKSNKKDDRSASERMQEALNQQQVQEEAAETLQEPETQEKQKLRAEDLTFWDMYPVEGGYESADRRQETDTQTQGQTTEPAKESEEKKTQSDSQQGSNDAENDTKKEEVVQEDPSEDGKHTLVKAADGTEEWVLISPYLMKNTYDFSNLSENAHLKKYTENGKKMSYVGADISKHNGRVNFNGMKAAGVDFVMIRLGARGYSTGQISLDENFVENIEGAIEAELDIGIYFFSQAINQEEATQEANFIVQNLEPYKEHITYPIAFDMETVSNDKTRIDGLSRDAKTEVAGNFLNCIQAAGYTPMIYGNKEWLIKSIDLTKLQDFDVWLSQDADTPDYPYQFAMWQYTTTGILNGITGDANLNLCFISYSDR